MEVTKHAHNTDYISMVQLNIPKLAYTHLHRRPRCSSHSYTLNWFEQRLKIAWSSKSEPISWTLVGLGVFLAVPPCLHSFQLFHLCFKLPNCKQTSFWKPWYCGYSTVLSQRHLLPCLECITIRLLLAVFERVRSHRSVCKRFCWQATNSCFWFNAHFLNFCI